MTRKEMEQCISLRKEIKAIEASMESPRSTYVTVFYKDYRTGKGIPKSLTGLDDGESELRILRAYHKQQIRKLKKRLDQAEKFIDGLDSSEMRTILRMRYINGNSQQEIADELHYSQSIISRKLTVFWFEQADKERRKKNAKTNKKHK